MDYRNIKVHVPTPEISKLVQEKLFEEGCTWYSGEGVKYTDQIHLYVGAYNRLSWGGCTEYFHQHEYKQVHYLQVLTGDDSGTLFRHSLRDRTYYQLGKDYCYWVNDEGELEGLIYILQYHSEKHPHNFTLLNVNEEEIMQDNSNEMPELEAGKHVVLMSYKNLGAAYYLVLKANGKLFGKQIDDPCCFSSKFSGDILEIHTLPHYGAEVFNPNSYNESTLIWKRADKAAEARKQYDELQRQIKQLQEQADKLGEKL